MEKKVSDQRVKEIFEEMEEEAKKTGSANPDKNNTYVSSDIEVVHIPTKEEVAQAIKYGQNSEYDKYDR